MVKGSPQNNKMDFKAAVMSSQTPLVLLTKKQIPVEHQIAKNDIAHITVKGQLSSKAAQVPHFSWETIFQAWAGQKPLLMCFHTPQIVQIFYSLSRSPNLLTNPPPPGVSILASPPKTNAEVSLKNNARAYLRAYFKELRLAIIQSWDPQVIKATLLSASALLQTQSWIHHPRRRQLAKTVIFDQRVTLPELYPTLP